MPVPTSFKFGAVGLLAALLAIIFPQKMLAQGCSQGQFNTDMQYVFGSYDDHDDQSDLSLFDLDEDHFSSYRVSQIQGGGRTRPQTLSGLEEIWLPLPGQRFAAEWGKIPTPNIPSNIGSAAPDTGQQDGQQEGGGSVDNIKDSKIPEEIGHVLGNSCMVREGSRLYFRGGVILDKRYETGLFEPQLCAINPFCDNPYDYIGIPVRGDFQGGMGWPVQHYTVQNWGAAEAAADRLAEGRSTQGDPAAVQTYDLQLWGEIQRVEIPDEYVPDGCDPPLGIGFLGGDDCPDWRYRRIWRGNIQMLSFSDPRIATEGWFDDFQADRGTGGVIHEFSITLSSTIYKEDWDFMEELEERVIALCGSAEGCGSSGATPPDSAQMVYSADGLSQREQLCQTAINVSGKFQAGDCEISEDNRYTGDMKADMGAVEAKLNSDLNLPGVSEAGKDATDTGQREDSLLDTQSQFSRFCMREIQEDSIRRANTPGDFESDIPEVCEDFREEGSSSSASVQAAQTASPAQQARQELRRQCEATIQRWQQLDQAGQLPEDASWEDMIPQTCQPYM